jgi:hypothetical protein
VVPVVIIIILWQILRDVVVFEVEIGHGRRAAEAAR